ncbi:MAG TPA: hypothetical protein VND64_12025 [Pirellulales bacterium]|nr:hypothetical protein [Pirellulales bacterium]
MKVFDLSRYRGVAIVAAGAMISFVALHYAFGIAFGARAERILPNQRPLGLELHAKNWSRVAALDRMHRRGQLAPDTRLGVVIGNSATQSGIQRRVLDMYATAANRWFVLTSAGMSFENLESYTKPIFYCSLKPSVVVMGVHPQMLVGEGYFAEEAPQRTLAVVGRRQRRLESRWTVMRALRAIPWVPRLLKLLDAHWIVKNRGSVADYLRTRAYDTRLAVFRAAGVSAEAIFIPATEPWDDEPLWWWQVDAPNAEFAKLQTKFWKKHGHFKAWKYRPDGPQARSFIRLIRAYRDIGAKVYIVLMPLRSPARAQIPANARPCLLKVVRDAFPGDPPEIIDAETEIPDQYFADEAHLSHLGAERLSKFVAEHMQEPTPEVGDRR